MSQTLLRSFGILNLIAWQLGGAPPAPFHPDIDGLARGPELAGYEPRAVRWSGRGDRIYFEWKRASEPAGKAYDTYVVGRNGAGLKRLSEEEAKAAPPAAGDKTRDRSLGVYTQDGDLFVYDYAADRARRLTQTVEPEADPHFLRDGRRIAFTRANNLYVLSLDDGSLVQMTDIRTGPAEDRKRAAGSQESLKAEERGLLEAVRDRVRLREAEEKKAARRKPFHLQPRQSVRRFRLTPDEKYVIAQIAERGDGARNTFVPNYVTETGYTEQLPSRTKVGDAEARTRTAILNVETGEARWVDHGLKENNAERAVNLGMPVWSDDGERAVAIGRSADNKDRWIFALDAAAAKVRPLFSDHDDAWIGGPGMAALGWMKDDRTIWFQSERDGFSHLYTLACDGGEPRQLTSGKWEALAAELSRDKTRFWLVTNELNPSERRLYSMPAAGGERTRITAAAGVHLPELSPDEAYIADVASYATRPPELFVQSARPGAEPLKLTSSPRPEFWTYAWHDAPIVSVPARDGVAVPGRLFKPAGARRGGPAVIFVHGAGYLQNVHLGWSNYYREWMFHQFLMHRGYTVLDIDYRGSAGYGRDWRTAIYRQMGGKDLDDHIDAARWLVKEHGVDARRIGIYGGSYGGFITLMAMFTQPGVFAAGAALRPVTDWAHYNHGYTSNILNRPQKDAEAYRRSSPIYFAEGLKGALLICHGVADTNVHFQDSVRLAQRLIELRKENWELAMYPVEDHGFVQAASWADEYKRIFKLFERNLRQKDQAE